LLLDFQVQAIITYPELAKGFNKSDLLCSELTTGKAHTAAAKVIPGYVVKAKFHLNLDLLFNCIRMQMI
jgi:hypothetical protein